MGTIAQKLQYTVNAVDDIQKALEEKGFDMTDVELSRYGDLIRLITSSSGSGGGEASGQPFNELDNVIFTSKVIQHVTMKDILFNSIIVDFKRQNYIYNELALQPLSLESTFILSKENVYVNLSLESTFILSKENVYVNIDSIIEIEQEE